MYVYLFVVFLSVALSILNYGKKSNGLKWSFVLITVYLGLRYMYGSDYPAYLDLFQQYNSDSFHIWDIKKMLDSDIYGEVGWQIINKLFKPFGYFGLNIALAVFENIIIYELVKKYVPPRWYWLAIVVYMLNTRLFLIGACSMERQWLAVCVVILATKYIEGRKIIPYVTLVLLAGTFHRSAFLMLPFYFLCFVKNLHLKVFHLTLFVVLLFIWNSIVPLLMNPLMNDIIATDENVFSDYSRYADRDAVNEQITIIGLITEVVITYIVPLLGLLYYSRLDSKTQKLILLYIVALFLKPFAEIIPMINRFDYFFIVFSICLIPLLLSLLAKQYALWAYAVVLMIVVIYMRQTAVFLTDSSWASSYVYKTILSLPWV